MKVEIFQLENRRAVLWLRWPARVFTDGYAAGTTLSQRLWTQQDRIEHSKQRKALDIAASLATSGLTR